MIQASDHGKAIWEIPVEFYPDGMVRIDWKYVERSIWRIALRSSKAIDFYALQQLLWALNVRSRKPQTMYAAFPGARQDRLNDSGDYLDSADFNKAMLIGREPCVTIDPHSLTSRNFFTSIIEAADCINVPPGKYAGVVAPDAGAAHRAQLVATKLGVPCFQAWKKRDIATGKLSGFGCEPTGLPSQSKLLIVDDICDGGGTFVGLAQLASLAKFDLHLWVTHGYFTQGTEKLREHFSHIYTTDSIAGAPRDGIIEIPIVNKWLKGEI